MDAKKILQKYLDVDKTPMKGNEWILDVISECTDSLTKELQEARKENKRLREFIIEHIINFRTSSLQAHEIQRAASKLLSEERKGE